MLYAAVPGGLELRATDDGGAILAGRFPYQAETELAPGRREVFSARAFQVADTVHLLYGHDFNRPLASNRDSLTVNNDDEALSFEARISPDIAATTHGRDSLALIRAGLSAGLSPGFRVSPQGERVQRQAGGVLRTVNEAELFELSIVTRPAYDSAAVEARCWQPNTNIRLFTLPTAWRYR